MIACELPATSAAMSERRVANDGLPYTLAEFIEVYQERGHFYWEQVGPSQPVVLSSAGASQPGSLPRGVSSQPRSVPSSVGNGVQIDLTGYTNQSLMEAMMHEHFKHFAGEESRSAIQECLKRTLYSLNQNLKTTKLLEKKINILERLLYDATPLDHTLPSTAGASQPGNSRLVRPRLMLIDEDSDDCVEGSVAMQAFAESFGLVDEPTDPTMSTGQFPHRPAGSASQLATNAGADAI